MKTEPQVTPGFVMEKEELFEEQQTPGEPAANGGQSAVQNVTWNNGAVIPAGARRPSSLERGSVRPQRRQCIHLFHLLSHWGDADLVIACLGFFM